MNFLYKNVKQIIFDYKNEMEQVDKYNKCVHEMMNSYKFQLLKKYGLEFYFPEVIEYNYNSEEEDCIRIIEDHWFHTHICDNNCGC